jgi:hypothetical protein
VVFIRLGYKNESEEALSMLFLQTSAKKGQELDAWGTKGEKLGGAECG